MQNKTKFFVTKRSVQLHIAAGSNQTKSFKPGTEAYELPTAALAEDGTFALNRQDGNIRPFEDAAPFAPPAPPAPDPAPDPEPVAKKKK